MVQAAGTSAQSAPATPVYYGMDPRVKTYWDRLPEDQRTEVLSLSVKHMRERANTHHMVSGECSPSCYLCCILCLQVTYTLLITPPMPHMYCTYATPRAFSQPACS